MDYLTRLLRERGLDYNQEELQRAWHSPEDNNSLGSWTEKYISDDTVLSPDEGRIWQKLKLQKQAQSGAQSRCFLDADLHLAIANLQSSTAAIEKQQKVLEDQKAALLILRRRTETQRSINESRPMQSPEATHLDFAVDELQQSLREDFTAIGDHVASTLRSVTSYATERLDADDKSLEAITRLRLSGGPEAKQPDVKAVDQWCKSLVLYQTAAVRAAIGEALDTELHQTTAGAIRDAIDRNDDDELRALQAELDSLRAEIASVAEMVVDHEYRKPITLGIERSKTASIQSRKAWFDYISASLRYITHRADTLCGNASELNSFQMALAEVEGILPPQDKPAQPELTPPKLERSTSGLRPLLLGRSASGTIEPDNPARLLRMLDAEIEVDKEVMTRTRLSKIIQSRLQRSDAQRALAEKSNLHVLSDYLSKENQEVGAVLDAIHANTTFNSKSLSDPTMDTKLERFETAIDQVGNGISGVESMLRESLPEGARKLSAKYK